MSRISWFLFRFILVLSIISILISAWNLYPLYVNPAIRNRAKDVIQVVAQEKGWLLSGVRIVRITNQKMIVAYKDYTRGEDPVHCYSINLHISNVEAVPLLPPNTCDVR